MLVLDYKLHVTPKQQTAIDEAIRTVQFVRNKCVRTWRDGQATRNDLQTLCAELDLKYSSLMLSGGKYWLPSTSTLWSDSARTAPSHIAFAMAPV